MAPATGRGLLRKSVHLLWHTGADDAWFAQLREALRGQTVHVDVSDSAVATAMLRLTTFREPVTAVVQAWWPEHAPDLSALAHTVVGYEVAETVRLRPPPTEFGERTPGLANIALLRRPPDLTPGEWLRRWHDDHTSVAIDTQATFGYVQNVVIAALTDAAPQVDGIVEELFPIEALTDPHAFYGSGGNHAELLRRVGVMAASVARFGADRNIDVIPTSRYVLGEPEPLSGRSAIM
ncbi:EthD domain-containing protein [Antrihabitans sp. YC2-6]|uniref:EthD domain-containing protein n=1 Tax=Antrihabitans sp. YC2-6 TaxID=2799498 RepID=UPI001F24D52F|nr:EthD domain-containing protein [Antrihabitans sp. YC2-6]